jgi:tetratricopeptide (TPR) repeat protein
VPGRIAAFLAPAIAICAGLPPARAQAVPAAPAYGLVIGVKRCCNDAVPPLDYARTDAARVYRFFVDQMKIAEANVLVPGGLQAEQDPDRIQILRDMNEIFRRGERGVIYIFASAYGFAFDSSDQSGSCILPRRGIMPRPHTIVGSNFLLASLSEMLRSYKDARVVLLLDVSRQHIEGNHINEVLKKLADAWNQPGIRRQSVTGILASGPGQKSYDTRQVGAFAYYLVEAALSRSGLNLSQIATHLEQAYKKDGQKSLRPQVVGPASGTHGGYVPHTKAPSSLFGSSAAVLLAGRTPWLPIAAQLRRSEQSRAFQDALALRQLTGTGGAYEQLRALDPGFREPQFADARRNLADALERQGEVSLFWYLAGDEFTLAPRDSKAKAFRGCEDAFLKAFEVARADEGERPDLQGRAEFCGARALMYEYGSETDKPGFLGRAEIRLRESMARLPNAPESMNALGIVALERGDLPSAQQRFEQAKRRAPLWPFPRHNLALALTEAGSYAEALTAYEDALHIAPHEAYLYYNHAVLLQRLNRRDEARKQYNRALAEFDDQKDRLAGWTRDPNDADFDLAREMRNTLDTYRADVYNALGTLEAARSRHRRAATYYEKALQIDCTLDIARHNLGLALMKQGKQKEAMDKWTRNDGFIPSQLELARAWSRSDPPKAIQEYKRVIKEQAEQPGAARTWLELAKVRYCTGDLPHAIDAVRHANAMSPLESSRVLLAGLEQEQAHTRTLPSWKCR